MSHNILDNEWSRCTEPSIKYIGHKDQILNMKHKYFYSMIER